MGGETVKEREKERKRERVLLAVLQLGTVEQIFPMATRGGNINHIIILLIIIISPRD